MWIGPPQDILELRPFLYSRLSLIVDGTILLPQLRIPKTGKVTMPWKIQRRASPNLDCLDFLCLRSAKECYLAPLLEKENTKERRKL